jgi:hypothetical protein
MFFLMNRCSDCLEQWNVDALAGMQESRYNAVVFEECCVDQVTGRVAVCEEGMSILQTFKERSVSLVCAVCGK